MSFYLYLLGPEKRTKPDLLPVLQPGILVHDIRYACITILINIRYINII